MIGDKLPVAKDSIELKLSTVDTKLDTLQKKVIGNLTPIYTMCGVGKNQFKVALDLAINAIKKEFENAKSDSGGTSK